MMPRVLPRPNRVKPVPVAPRRYARRIRTPFPALGQPAALAPCGFQRRQQFLPQPLGDRPRDHHRPRRPRALVQYQRLPELPYQGRSRPPASTGRAHRSIDAGTPVDPRRAALRQGHRTTGVVPEPVYGGQLQDMSVPGVAPKAKCGSITRRFRCASRTAPSWNCASRICRSPNWPMGRCTRTRVFPPASPRR